MYRVALAKTSYDSLISI